jgi:hypothetical protein
VFVLRDQTLAPTIAAQGPIVVLGGANPTQMHGQGWLGGPVVETRSSSLAEAASPPAGDSRKRRPMVGVILQQRRP